MDNKGHTVIVVWVLTSGTGPIVLDALGGKRLRLCTGLGVWHLAAVCPL